MSGLFGTRAILQTDINLILQIAAISLLLIGYLYKRKYKFKLHGASMGIATTLHIISFITIMGPVFVSTYSYITTNIYTPLVLSIVVHAIAGAIVLPLAGGLLVFWVPRPSRVEKCFKRRKIMILTIILWVVSITFGILAYILAYL